jgi:KTSC domain
VERQPVDSSLIRSVGYDLFNSILEIEFAEPNRIYEFFDVPYSVYSELMEAESRGSYFNDDIKDLYAYQELEVQASSSEASEKGSGRDRPE